ncbi:DUF3798 domain-containing protein [Pyramidobacter sp. SM-530-WT-4B]|uniref:DUF3798 domain-containing protein n=1 Tax=Pyramidobacter porci TaxID=2605789 RepID=A0A6L5YFP5_9BACT|nr:DUF3798 domain-containing protein [Pyramidobacter porci]MCI6261351.1 DUF3798 domain-containing protein [Pyramidobacter sp.]MDY2647487.1 DUF3798 domain-containing protein [Pyramidobacter porci]MST56507.1 DUF3798 domain-containing protein [Pyramidobacter porci]
MRKFLTAVWATAFLCAAGTAFAAAPFHIGVCTETVSQAEDNLRGAEELIRRYGEVADGGYIKHVTMPDNFMAEMETTISQIAAFADDPLMKVVVVMTAVPGTTEAFRRIREKRPDILLFAGQPQEDPGVIESIADLATNVDSITRGYLIIYGAKKLGATDFVHISFPRHLSSELKLRRFNIMKAACEDMGINFHAETAPDPMSDVGVAGAQQFILEHVPAWLDRYGKQTAFFCTNDAHTEPLLKQIAALGGIFVEADVPSPLMGYPGALGLDLSNVAGNFPAILKRIEEEVVRRGGAKRMGTWAYSSGFTTVVGLAEYGKKCAEAGVSAQNFRRQFKAEDLFAVYAANTPGAKWNGSYYRDAQTGLEKKNHLLVYQDTYVFGQGYLGNTELPIPEKYLQIK